MSGAISLRVPNLPAKVRKVVRQIETSRSPDPIMRRPCADREEKRGPAGATVSQTMTDQEQLDLNGPIREGSQGFRRWARAPQALEPYPEVQAGPQDALVPTRVAK